MIKELYSDLILELNKKPLNKNIISNPNVQFHDTNPFCGDEIEIMLKVNKEGAVEDAGFQGNGCALSQASASLCTEIAKGKNADEIVKMEIDEVLEKLGIPHVAKNAMRIKCVMLPLKALKICGWKMVGKE
jgi:nitrogen fixation NifU-like protein